MPIASTPNGTPTPAPIAVGKVDDVKLPCEGELECGAAWLFVFVAAAGFVFDVVEVLALVSEELRFSG